ncbi:hypothetical protein HUK80_04920 [Flavobacterium sp. MAH-1]|uniref:ADP-heptose:LPS heptosyltransferase n=1 Tax=Flavobacterium agri TaxID=2743471 RepID=A0A7Y8Y0B7_9FLAO|nr:glycosyltransferase family 9 protein [Flavobacterium agri]NUY80229.1 hypothetical protein [Flavobacterium agri]NYA70254.1 hypothetical protein [Flavobacterium agri]
MKKILFLHDTDLSLKRGAELTINQLVNLGLGKGFRVETDLLTDLESARNNILSADLVIVNSTSRCKFEKELLVFLIDSGIGYAKVEYDYNFCSRRNIICTVDPNQKLCCDGEKFHLYRKLFSKSLLNCFQSPRHLESHKEFFGEAIHENVLIMPPTVEVDSLQISSQKDDSTIPFFGDLSFLKGAKAFVEFASANPQKRFVVYGRNKTDLAIPTNIEFRDMIDNEKVLEILGRTKQFFCQPFWPEPSGRLAAEAFLSGCEIIANDRIGTFSFDFYPNDIERAKKEMKETPEIFWSRLEEIIGKAQPEIPTMGKVLVKKNSGGLGDIFFCLPALNLLNQAADEVSFAVEARLVSFLSGYVKNSAIVDRNLVDESDFDTVVELGNYPAYMGVKLPDAIKYSTHKRIRQHAAQHYVDGLSRLHRDLNYSKIQYPYFPKKTNLEKPYFTIHPGAGFLLKAWPAKEFAKVIAEILERYPELECRIFLGKDEPDPTVFLRSDTRISIENGDLEAVAETLKAAIFHIGNDSGITHLAEAFNIPTVGIYGPTGPGVWGSLAEMYETVYGKEGNCDLTCDFRILVNCQDRVCLSSITPSKVMGAVLKLLQRIFPEKSSKPMINPGLDVKWNVDDCILKLGQTEFTINFNNAETKSKVLRLLSGNFDGLDQEMQQFTDFLEQQFMILTPPETVVLMGNSFNKKGVKTVLDSL